MILAFEPVILDGYVLATDVTGFSKPVAERIRKARQSIRRPAIDEPDHRHRRLLRACRERPRHRRATECGQQFPPSDGDCHTPLPCEVRKDNDITPRARCPNCVVPGACGTPAGRSPQVRLCGLTRRAEAVVEASD